MEKLEKEVGGSYEFSAIMLLRHNRLSGPELYDGKMQRNCARCAGTGCMEHRYIHSPKQATTRQRKTPNQCLANKNYHSPVAH